MLWIVGGISLTIWLVGAFLLHKGGGWHTILLFTIAAFVVQFVQDRRTRAYKANL